ncbi:hypothetical protein D3C80_926710 [compost metagenome]
MRMHMLSAVRLQPLHNTARLGQIDQMIGPRAISAQAHAQGQPQGRTKMPRARTQHLQQRHQQALDAVLQHIAGFIPLRQVLGILQLSVPATQGNALNLDALAFQRQNFAANEAMADLGILIDEISNAHRSPTVNPRYE